MAAWRGRSSVTWATFVLEAEDKIRPTIDHKDITNSCQEKSKLVLSGRPRSRRPPPVAPATPRPANRPVEEWLSTGRTASGALARRSVNFRPDSGIHLDNVLPDVVETDRGPPPVVTDLGPAAAAAVVVTGGSKARADAADILLPREGTKPLLVGKGNKALFRSAMLQLRSAAAFAVPPATVG
jgi:hypothetical protein